jgi:hypothetical protein
MILFTKRKNLEGFIAPKLFNTGLKLNNQGVILDSKWNWKSYIDNRIQKTSRAYWQGHRAIEKTWGLKPKVVY